MLIQERNNMKFTIRTLLVATAVAAVFTLPVYRQLVELYKNWFTPKSAKTVVVVPPGGILIVGGSTIEFLPDGRRRVNGIIEPAR